MANYAFAVPLLPGKTEAWKKYIEELMGPRHEDFIKSRQRAGLNKTEQIWLQHTPMGDFVVVYWESPADNPTRVFERFMKSDEPFDVWFREKVLIECHGMKVTDIPPRNEAIINYITRPVDEKTYAETRKR
jgi:hypothetical protein